MELFEQCEIQILEELIFLNINNILNFHDFNLVPKIRF